MKIFISWSGSEAHAVALALRDWLPSVLQTVEPFVSSEDISKGARWASDLATHLEATDFGIVCLTRANLTAPWLLFEAGALSKRLDVGAVAPFLHGISKSDVTLPLSSFQLTEPTKDDVLKLVRSINSATTTPLSEARVQSQVQKWWPDFSSQLKQIQAEDVPTVASEGGTTQQEPRPEREMLEELLGLVRDLGRAGPAAAAPAMFLHPPNPTEAKRRREQALLLEDLRSSVAARLKQNGHIHQFSNAFDEERRALTFHINPHVRLSAADTSFIESQAARAGISVILLDMDGELIEMFPPF